jgi:hypothetical protein
MKMLVLFISLIIICSCQKSIWMTPSTTTQNQLPKEMNYLSEQDALGNWLLSQSQQVRDDFKKDFTFSAKEIKEYVDSLKINARSIKF